MITIDKHSDNSHSDIHWIYCVCVVHVCMCCVTSMVEFPKFNNWSYVFKFSISNCFIVFLCFCSCWLLFLLISMCVNWFPINECGSCIRLLVFDDCVLDGLCAMFPVWMFFFHFCFSLFSKGCERLKVTENLKHLQNSSAIFPAEIVKRGNFCYVFFPLAVFLLTIFMIFQVCKKIIQLLRLQS